MSSRHQAYAWPAIKDAAMRQIYSDKAILRNVTVETGGAGELLHFYASMQEPEAVEDDNILFTYATDGSIEQVDMDYMYDTTETESDE